MSLFITNKLKAVLCATAASTALLVTPSVSAEEEAFSLSANTALVSDYRFRGLSLSNKDLAIQGGFDVATKSGFYAGAWGSSIENYKGSEHELDLYAGYATSFENLDFDIGILAYTYPGSSNTTYWEAYSSVGSSLDTLSWTLGAAYAFKQDNIDGNDNLYLYLDAGLPIADTPLSLAGHIGYEDGAFGDASFGKNKWDWSLGVSYDFKQFSLGVSYVDTNITGNTTKAGVVASLSASF